MAEIPPTRASLLARLRSPRDEGRDTSAAAWRDLLRVGYGFANHTYNEVYVGNRWRRLNSPSSDRIFSTNTTSA